MKAATTSAPRKMMEIPRDERLPQLERVLRPERMIPLLGEAARQAEWRVSYLRYKPATNCLVLYESRDQEGAAKWIYFKIFAEDREPRPSDEALLSFYDKNQRTAMVRFPCDLQIPAIRRLFTPGFDRALLDRLMQEPRRQALETSFGRWQPIRYKPERRCVLMGRNLEGREPAQHYARFYAQKDIRALVRSYEHFTGFENTSFTIPSLLGFSRKHRAVVIEGVPGQRLADLLEAGNGDSRAALDASARALALWHRTRPPSKLPHLASGTRKLLPAYSFLQELAPHLSSLSERLVALLGETEDIPGQECALLHGDFYDDQVIIRPDGRVGFIDLDNLCLGSRESDVANFCAHLYRRALERGAALSVAASTGRRFLEEYQKDSGRPLLASSFHWHLSASLLRLAPRPFRYAQPNWGTQIEQILERACQHAEKAAGTASRSQPWSRNGSNGEGLRAEQPFRSAAAGNAGSRPLSGIGAGASLVPMLDLSFSREVLCQSLPIFRPGSEFTLHSLSILDVKIAGSWILEYGIGIRQGSIESLRDYRLIALRADGKKLERYGRKLEGQLRDHPDAATLRRLIAVREDLSLLVFPFPLDHRIDHLKDAADPERMIGRLGKSPLRGLVDPAGDEWLDVQALRHVPGRRCQFLYQLHRSDGRTSSFLGKVYRDERGAEVLDRMDRVARAYSDFGDPALTAPRPLGYLPDWKILLQEKAEGCTLLALILSGKVAKANFIAAARTLAILHQSRIALPSKHGSKHGVGDELRVVENAWRRLTEVAPADHPAFECLLVEIRKHARRVSAGQPVPIHRDFYDKQLLVNGENMTLIDLDTLAEGPPEIDLANFSVHLHLRGLQLDSTAGSRNWIAEFIQEYESRTSSPIRPSLYDFFSAATCFRLACKYFFRPGGFRVSQGLLVKGAQILSEGSECLSGAASRAQRSADCQGELS